MPNNTKNVIESLDDRDSITVCCGDFFRLDLNVNQSENALTAVSLMGLQSKLFGLHVQRFNGFQLPSMRMEKCGCSGATCNVVVAVIVDYHMTLCATT